MPGPESIDVASKGRSRVRPKDLFEGMITPRWVAWLERYAAHRRLTLAAMIDLALSESATRDGFDAPPPRPRKLKVGRLIVPDPFGSLPGQLRTAIEESGQIHYRIAQKAGIAPALITRFFNGDRGLTLESAGKITDALGLKLGPTLTRRRRSLDVELRTAIEELGRGAPSKIAKGTGLARAIITRFLNGDRGLTLESAGKITDFLGLKLEPAKAPRTVPEPADPPRGRGRPRRKHQAVILAEEKPSNPAPWKRQPIVRGLVKPVLTEKQYRVIKALLVAGSEGLTGAELRIKSGVPGCLRILKDLKSSDYQWDSVIHYPGRGNINYIIE
jgi:plasmid maintenance system antidote protein VapI